MECSVQGCIRHVFAKGLCHPHYDANRKANAPRCTSEACDEPQHAAGLCNRHYRAAKAAVAASCAVEGCGRAAVAGGLCDSHRKRKDRNNHLDTKRPEDWGAKVKHPLYHTWAWQRREATNEGLSEAWKDFWRFVADVGERPTAKHKLRRRDDARPLGPDNFEWRKALEIVETTSTKEWRAAWSREYRVNNPTRHRNTAFKTRYGVGLDDYDAMHASQKGVCAICKRPEKSLNQHTHEPRRLAVDHCHNSKKVRGLLCKSCNTAIGALDEDPALFRAALRYLAKHRE
jgi:hypothetical protein